ncbi:6-phosphogluconolactonase [Myxococcota bacterium]|nr:6-phosphogluconolactonase [Myxococcota bacterium]
MASRGTPPSGPAEHESGTPAPELIVSADPVARAAALLVEWMHALANEATAWPSLIPPATRHAASRAMNPMHSSPEIRLAISGGSALDVVLRAAPLAGPLWRRVALTWVDERCVPLEDPESNRGEAMRRGLPAPARIVPLLEDGEAPEAAVARYARCYAEELGGGLDLVVLGMGPDGHVASLFPGGPWAQGGVVEFVADSPKPPARRLTLTRGVLSAAHRTLLFATGESKRGALERLLRGDPSLPATGLSGLVVVTELAVRK